MFYKIKEGLFRWFILKTSNDVQLWEQNNNIFQFSKKNSNDAKSIQSYLCFICDSYFYEVLETFKIVIVIIVCHKVLKY